MNWSSGGGLSASAYLEHAFGDVWVDGERKSITPIDGVYAKIDSWLDNSLELSVRSALETLKSPYTDRRAVRIKFGSLAHSSYKLSINGISLGTVRGADMVRGIEIQI